MVQAFSRLKRVLDEQNVTVPELHRRLLRQGLRVNVKSLYRLSNDRQPLQRLDLRLQGVQLRPQLLAASTGSGRNRRHRRLFYERDWGRPVP